MNTKTDQSSESVSDPRSNPCFGTDPKVACLKVLPDDGGSHLLPYAQFLRAVTTPNPALEASPDAPPQKMTIFFAGAEVTVLGSGLSTIEGALQELDLKFVKAAPPRSAAAMRCHAAAVSITFNKEDV
jgi:hypothetical protein